MICWYEDKELSIYFDRSPKVSIRYCTPDMSEAKKKNLKNILLSTKENLKFF